MKIADLLSIKDVILVRLVLAQIAQGNPPW